MTKTFWLILFTYLIQLPLGAQNINTLKTDINQLILSKSASVGVSIQGMTPSDTLSINGHKQLPMQSVYKYHLAVAILAQVDQGVFHLNDTITVTKADLNTPLWSMIRKHHPEGAKLTLAEIIKYTVANSDNVGCDILFDMIGGPIVVENFWHQLGVTDLRIRDNESTMQADWELQYQNWTTPNAAIKALSLIYNNNTPILSPKSHAFLWRVMKQSWLGKLSLITYLPQNTIIAHKTGHSGKNDAGLTGAQNDIGIVFLPNGNFYYISILISNSTETSTVNQKLIADISKLTYTYFNTLE